MKRFYYEQDEDSDDWFVIENEGGYEQGAYFDVVVFCSTTQDDAGAACDKLNYLYELTKKEQ